MKITQTKISIKDLTEIKNWSAGKKPDTNVYTNIK